MRKGIVAAFAAGALSVAAVGAVVSGKDFGLGLRASDAAPAKADAVAPAGSPSPLPMNAAPQPSLAALVERVTPAVVNVAVKSVSEVDGGNNPLFQDPTFRRFFGIPDQMPRQERASEGSGVIVDARKGYILTNFHVVDKASEITVTLKDRREFKAKVIGKDQETDVALLQIDSDNLTALPFGDPRTMRVGDYVMAVGNPFGLGQTVTAGIISAVGRSGLNIEGYEDFIQTDAAINPGNSGGALVNLNGELIGINTAIVGPAGGNVGIGFAVPTTMARAVMDQLVQFGKVTRGRIGVAIQDLTPDIAKSLGITQGQGALVSRVEKGSSAEGAGVKAGDVVIEVDHRPIASSSELRNSVGTTPVGQSVTLTILREGSKKEVKVAVAKGPDQQTAQETTSRLEGAVLAGSRTGVRVVDVAPDSAAYRAGLRKGDVITAVNRTSVKSPDELEKALEGSARQTALFVVRDGQDLVLIV